MKRVLVAAEEVRQAVSLPEVADAALAYWLERRGAATAPRIEDIDLSALGPALPHALLWDVKRPGPQFICRFAGTALCDLAGHDLRGVTLEAMLLDEAPKIRAEYVSVVETLKLHYAERYMKWSDTSYRRYRRLLFPLRGKGESVDGLLCCQYYD